MEKNIAITKGFNKRLDELHAGILNIKLSELDNLNFKRIKIAEKYLKLIKSKKIILPKLNLKRNMFFIYSL